MSYHCIYETLSTKWNIAKQRAKQDEVLPSSSTSVAMVSTENVLEIIFLYVSHSKHHSSFVMFKPSNMTGIKNVWEDRSVHFICSFVEEPFLWGFRNKFRIILVRNKRNRSCMETAAVLLLFFFFFFTKRGLNLLMLQDDFLFNPYFSAEQGGVR